MAQHVFDHLQRRRVGPLDIVQHDQQRVLARLGVEDLDDGLEQEVPLDRRVRTVDAHPGHEVVQLGEQQRQHAAVGGDATTGLGGHGAQRGAQRLDHRLERHDRFGCRPSPQHDGALFVCLGGEAGGEPGLAGTGLADEQGQVAVAGGHPRPHLVQQRQLVGAADERRRAGSNRRAGERYR